MSSEKQEYFKKYYKENKDAWMEYHQCEICGGKYCRANRYNHLKTKKHMLAEQKKQINDLHRTINNIKEQLK